MQAALQKLAACAAIAKSDISVISAAAWQTNCSLEDMRERLQTTCRDAGPDGSDTPACKLVAAAAYSDRVLAEIKLAELLGIPGESAEKRTTPKACRANL